MPSGLHPELEDELQTAFGLREAIVVDAIDAEDQIARDLGRRRGVLSRDDAEADATSSASRRGARRCWRWSRRCIRIRAPPARASSRFSAASAIPAPKCMRRI